MKKLSIIFFITALALCLSTLGEGAAKAATVVSYGKISWYPGLGKKGSDQKVITQNDCAVDYSERSIPKGTKIVVKNLDNGKSLTLQKWDWGRFKHLGVIVDVTKPAYLKLGGSIDKGRIKNGRTERSTGAAIAPN